MHAGINILRAELCVAKHEAGITGKIHDYAFSMQFVMILMKIFHDMLMSIMGLVMSTFLCHSFGLGISMMFALRHSGGTVSSSMIRLKISSSVR